MNEFEEAMKIADEEGYRVSVNGLASIIDIFDHLTSGGTVDNHMIWTRGEITAMLGATVLTVADNLVDRAPGA